MPAIRLVNPAPPTHLPCVFLFLCDRVVHSRKIHSGEGRLEGRGFCGVGVLNNAAPKRRCVKVNM